jgi:DNA-binding NtrC family response regulator
MPEHDPSIHVMVTDVVMPGLNGRELATRAAACQPDMRVIYMSGYTDDAIVHHGVLEAGMAFLQKPFTPLMMSYPWPKHLRGSLAAASSSANRLQKYPCRGWIRKQCAAQVQALGHDILACLELWTRWRAQ